MSAEDSLAVSMLVIFALAGASLMTILFSLVRNAGQKDELAELMAEEVDDSSRKPSGELAGHSDGEAQPWEQDADWWKE